MEELQRKGTNNRMAARTTSWAPMTTAGPARPSAADAAAFGEAMPNFAARGACVPFDTPALQTARVRADERDGLSLLLRNFSTNNATFVMPWKAVPGTIPMSPRDRALHHEVEANQALTPRKMRAAVRIVGASGLGGPAAQAAVVQAVAEERRQSSDLQAAVLIRALQACGFADPGERLPQLNIATTPEALRGAAAALQVPAAQLFSTAEMISVELLPVGLRAPDGGSNQSGSGPLRRLLLQLASFARHLHDRIQAAPTEARAQYERAAAAATATIMHSDRTFGRLDREFENMHTLVTGWPARRDYLRREMDQLYWLLDGWEPTIEHYTLKLTDWLTLSQDRTLAILANLAPPVPATAARLAPGPAPSPPHPSPPHASAQHGPPPHNPG